MSYKNKIDQSVKVKFFKDKEWWAESDVKNRVIEIHGPHKYGAWFKGFLVHEDTHIQQGINSLKFKAYDCYKEENRYFNSKDEVDAYARQSAAFIIYNGLSRKEILILLKTKKGIQKLCRRCDYFNQYYKEGISWKRFMKRFIEYVKS